MKSSWKGVVLFILLNIFVSVCATMTVLVFWDRTRGMAQGSLLPELGGKTAEEIQTSQEQTTPPSTQSGPIPTSTQSFISYQVVAGDDFTSIAQKFGVSVEEIIAVNGFTIDQPLGVGEVLQIPALPTPLPPGVVEIKSVAGAGDLETERVLVKYNGDGELSLADWKLEDGNGNVFLFPQSPQDLLLFRDGAIYVVTKSGVNSAVELFWGLQVPVWESGETATLRDAQGEVRAVYQIP